MLGMSHSQLKCNSITHHSKQNDPHIDQFLHPLITHILSSSSSQPSSINYSNSKCFSNKHISEVNWRRILNLCINILNSDFTDSLTRDEFEQSNLIRKKLIRESSLAQNESIITRYTYLYSKIKAKTTLRRRNEILKFLYLLSGTNQLENLDTKISRLPAVPSEAPTKKSSSILPSNKIDYQETPYQRYLQFIDKNASKIPENMLLRDVLLSLRGIDGCYLSYSTKKEKYIFHSSAEISGSAQILVEKLSHIGQLYSHISQFVIKYEKEENSGQLEKSFCDALKNELCRYTRFIEVLERILLKQIDEAEIKAGDPDLTLKRLYVGMQEWNRRLSLLQGMIDACREDKGSVLVDNIHSYGKHGDSFVNRFIQAFLEEVSRPLHAMLDSWVYKGEVNDPHEEFFIGINQDVSDELFWEKRYFVRDKMRPRYITKPLSQKILEIGKNINYIRYRCEELYLTRDEKSEEEASIPRSIFSLESYVETNHVKTSRRLKSILLEKYGLMTHLVALKDYFLLCRGDWTQRLMDVMEETLNEPARYIYRQKLHSLILSASLHSSARKDPCASRLDARIIESQNENLTGWDIFRLDYVVEKPLDTILNEKAMQEYRRIWRFLWRIKRVANMLMRGWKMGMYYSKEFPNLEDAIPNIQWIRVATSQMLHFLNQLEYVILFEGIERAWNNLRKDMECAVGLDELLTVHEKYLKMLQERVLFSSLDKGHSTERINGILKLILVYLRDQEKVYELAAENLHRLSKRDRETTGNEHITHLPQDTLDSHFESMRSVAAKFEAESKAFSLLARLGSF
ncbi:uncharacterized protein VTP21DRAFT_7076 [Calcarisporiella thermophila]|uniref:uncharacterized protein n=1 Tax=Calcarisporiella thermophila TaxID=911321 RepID=UPI0037445FAB